MPTAEGNREEMVRLAAFLRQHPDSLNLNVSEIAARAQTSEDVVRSALTSSNPQRKAAKKAKAKDRVFSPAALLDRVFARPLLFVGLTFALAVIVAYLIPSSSDVKTTANQVSIRLNEAVEVGAFLLAFVLHMACYAWRGLSRYAIYGAVLVGTASTTLAVGLVYLKNPVPSSPLLPLYIGAAMIMASVLYAVIGVGCSSLGAYVRFRREEASMSLRSRQDLLQRLFEIEEALRMPPPPSEVRRFAWPWLDQVRSRIFLYAAVIGFGLSLIMSATTVVFPGPTPMDIKRLEARASQNPERADQARRESMGEVSAGFFVMQVLFGTLAVLVQLGLAYLAGRPVRAILVSLVCGYASTLATLIPIGTMGYQWLLGDDLRWSTILKGPFVPNMISGTVAAIMLGLFAGVGAYVEERAYQTRRRLANDPSALLSEFVTIQRSLNAAGQTKCVIVVDAAKSSLMKSNADPLIAEWSFRAYQQFLAEIVRDCHGRIYSTAGDGAMAAFDHAADAFHAARTIQTKVADFNAYVSRLKDPFRLRIGIHCGEVSGDLDEVEFTEVLDIAAHVESASQVGGIALTSTVAEQLPDHRFAEIQESIDGHRVFLALNPTLDPEADLANP